MDFQMAFRKKFSFLCRFIGLGILAFIASGVDSKSPRYTGNLIVKFKETDRVSNREKDKLHSKASTKLLYRSKHFPYDVVKPARNTGKFDLQLVNRICSKYRRQVTVTECSFESVPTPDEADPSKSHHDNGARQAGLSSASSLDCEPVKNHGEVGLMNGKLSAFWGYDFIGVDLARESLLPILPGLNTALIGTGEQVVLKDLPSENLSSELRAVADSFSFSPQADFRHGTQVASIVAGRAPYGTAVKAQYAVVNQGIVDKNSMFPLADRAIDRKIKIFSQSTGFPDFMKDIEIKFHENGIIIVRSAGNFYPSEKPEDPAPEIPIQVGQLSPLGGMVYNSSSFPEVTIAAPGRVFATFAGKTVLFGGTSGAQPVVAGCLANVVSVLGDVTPEEAKALVVKTAIPTLNSKQSKPRNGGGTINCFKLVEVAKRLKGGWPANRSRILSDQKLYDFHDEAIQLVGIAEQQNEPEPCAQTKKLKALRAAFLLDSKNERTIEAIVQLYKKLGYSGNALLYESMLGLSKKRIQQLQPLVFGDLRLEPDLIRLSAEHFPDQELFEKSLDSPIDDARDLALYFAELPKDRAVSAFVKRFKGDFIRNDMLFYPRYFDQLKLPADALFNVCDQWIQQADEEKIGIRMGQCLLVATFASSNEMEKSLAFIQKNLGVERFRKRVLGAISWIGTLKPQFADSIKRLSVWRPDERKLLDSSASP